jgi:spermidine synthase
VSGSGAGGWIEETLHPDYRQRFGLSRTLLRERSAYQEIAIVETPRFGRMMLLDGVVQVTEADEPAYHEMLTHLPMLAHGAVRRLLVLGGGDGGILREALRHPGVERATLVELDPAVIAAARTHMPTVPAGAFEDPRTELVIGDAARFVADTAGSYDLVVVDSTDPAGPAEALFTRDFYAACRRCLSPGGVLVAQNGVPFLQPEELKTSWARLRPLFADVAFYTTVVPSYAGGLMALGWATDDVRLRPQPVAAITARYAAAGLATRYYTPALHGAAFALPAFIAQLLA